MDAYEKYLVAIRPMSFFRPSEHIDESMVGRLLGEVTGTGVWKSPLPVEARSGLIMDGNHRYSVAIRLGLRFLPCVPLDYGDKRLRVTRWKDGGEFRLDELLEMAHSSTLLPYKCTRHTITPALPEVEVPLELLR